MCHVCLDATAHHLPYWTTTSCSLLYAAAEGHTDTCEKLVALGADLKATDGEGDTGTGYAFYVILTV